MCFKSCRMWSPSKSSSFFKKNTWKKLFKLVNVFFSPVTSTSGWRRLMCIYMLDMLPCNSMATCLPSNSNTNCVYPIQQMHTVIVIVEREAPADIYTSKYPTNLHCRLQIFGLFLRNKQHTLAWPNMFVKGDSKKYFAFVLMQQII